MKFSYYYNELLTEARTMATDKFYWVAENMGDWLFDELHRNPNVIQALPNMDQFKTYVGTTIKKTPTTNDLVENLWLMDTFLNRLNPKDSANFIKSVLISFPKIKGKILRFGKPEAIGKRGRPVGSKNKPKEKTLPDDAVDITPTEKPQVNVQPEPQGRRGRPKKYFDDLSPMERAKYRREGPDMIPSLESKVLSLDNEVNQIIARIKKIMVDIDKRKKFFGQS